MYRVSVSRYQTFIARCCRCGRYTYVQCCQAATDHSNVSLPIISFVYIPWFQGGSRLGWASCTLSTESMIFVILSAVILNCFGSVLKMPCSHTLVSSCGWMALHSSRTSVCVSSTSPHTLQRMSLYSFLKIKGKDFVYGI